MVKMGGETANTKEGRAGGSRRSQGKTSAQGDVPRTNKSPGFGGCIVRVLLKAILVPLSTFFIFIIIYFFGWGKCVGEMRHAP